MTECLHCGAGFEGVSTRRYCSETCRKGAASARRKTPRVVERQGSVRAALDEAVAAATHLTVRDAAAVAAARALADKIDAWDVVVRWAIEDAQAVKGARPAVPQNDNTSLGSFLKYLDALQLVPPAAASAKPGPVSTASPAQQALNEMRNGLRVVPEVG